MWSDRLDELLLRFVEQRPPALPVEPQHSPDLAGRRTQPGDHFLVAAHGLVETPARGVRRVAAGGLVQRGDPGMGPGDVGEIVQIVPVVLVRQPFGREFGQAFMEVAGDQQRRRVEGEPARCPVIRNDGADDLRAVPPVTREILGFGGQPDNLVHRSLPHICCHDTTVSSRWCRRNTTSLEYLWRWPPAYVQPAQSRRARARWRGRGRRS